MMEILFKWFRFYLCLLFFQLCNGNPISPKYTETDTHVKLLTGAISLLLTVCCLVFLAACLCCQRRKQFEVQDPEKQFRDSPVTASSISDLDHGHVNPIANGEFTIFSPLSPHNNNVFHANETKAKNVEDPLANGYDISSWFSPNEKDYPRTKLKYIKELGTGWFGKVVEGAVQDVDNKRQSWTPVVVRILDATSSQKEKILFLQNAAVYRNGNHANILSLVGKSLETVPYLLLQEHCPQGDLKAYLKSNKTKAEQFLSTDYPLLWCHQLASALKFIHEHDIVHLDLASRNCHLTSNLTLRLGDYGLGPFKYPSDYYQGQPAVPVRWCAPESLNCTQTTIQPKRITPEANVWSLAVTMWEICECGEQPYWAMTDDEVISQVLGPPSVRLGRPSYSVLYTDYIFRLMQLCWTSAESRPKVLQIHIMLTDLRQVHKNTSSSDILDVDEFDRRWESCKPNTIIKTDHIPDILLTSEEGDDVRKSLSLSLTNLHGSLDNLNFSDQETSTNEQSKTTRDDIFQRMSSGSETEEENWKNKVERGAYTEKVRQKSRSVADLMILTHVDYSESESETPLQSLEYNRVNYKNVRLAGLDGVNSLENTSLTFGSEGNLLSVQDTFKQELRKLQEERRDSLPFVPDNISQNSLRNTDATSNSSSSRLIQELNSPVDIQPVNQIFNVYNVTIDNFSPIHMNNKLSEILDVNSQLKPEWREVDKLSQINSELNQEIRELEKLNEVQRLNSELEINPELYQEMKLDILNEVPDFNHLLSKKLREVEKLNEIQENLKSNREVNSKLNQDLGKAENLSEILGVNSELSRDCNSELNQGLSEVDKFSDTTDVNPKFKQEMQEINLSRVELSENLDINSKLKQELICNANEAETLKEPVDASVELRRDTPEQLDFKFDLKETSIEPKVNNDLNLKEQETDRTSVIVDVNLELTQERRKEDQIRHFDINSELKQADRGTEVNSELNENFSVVEKLQINLDVDSELREVERLSEVLNGELNRVVREVDCKNILRNHEGSENCDNFESGLTNLTVDVLRGGDSLIQDENECEAFNFNIKLASDANSTVLNVLEHQKAEERSSRSSNNAADIPIEGQEETDKSETNNAISHNGFHTVIDKSLEETVGSIIDEIVTRSLREATERSSSNCHGQNFDNISNLKTEVIKPQSPDINEIQICDDKTLPDVVSNETSEESLLLSDKDSIDQIVNFDLSLNQEEAMPNSLTHSSVFTSSTPFSKRSLENKFSSMKFEENIENCVPDNRDLNYSLETWDNFLGSTLDHQNQHPENMFDSFSSEPRSLLFIEGDDRCDKFEQKETRAVVLQNDVASNSSYVVNNGTHNVEISKVYNEDDSEGGDVVHSNVIDVLNGTQTIEEPEVLEAYSGEVWDNFLTSTSGYPNHRPENVFANFSSEPQSLIFIESEGIYKNCDNITETENRIKSKNNLTKVLYVDDDAIPGTSKDGMYEMENNNTYNVGDVSTDDDIYSSPTNAVNSTCDTEDAILNSTYTKDEPDVLEAPSEGVTDPNVGSFENGGGWFLHPQPTNELSGEIQVQSPSTDTYIGFGIDDEIMSAIRNELLSKLPHAQGNKVREEDEWDTFEPNEVFLRYNVYNTPLSPIPEESLVEEGSGTNSPRPERESEETDWSGRTDTDTLTQEIETTSAHTLESPLRGTFNRHTPSQDSCCSNDTLFNLDDLICGIPDMEKDADFPLNFRDEENVETGCEKDGEGVEDSGKRIVKNEISCSENSATVSSKPQEIANNFLSTERCYSSVVPLPSPEENPWKQLPASLLNYNQLALSNTTLSIKEEPNTKDYSDCDNSSNQEICDIENVDTPTTEPEDDDSETLNATFTKDHPDILELPVLPDLVEDSSKIDTKSEDVNVVEKQETHSVVDQDNSDKENIEPLYENSAVKEEVDHHIENSTEEQIIKEDHLYENTDIKNNEQLYENMVTEIDPFDDYVNIVNMENSKNRLESDVSDKDPSYINPYEHIDKDEDDSIYGILTDIRFTGPTDSQMMSTSFSENNDEQGWESGSDSRSSSSGEFIWREGEHEESLKALRAAPQDVLESITPMEGIAEDNYEESDLSSSFSDDEESPEFVPSAWDKFAMPSKSALRSPEKTPKKQEEKKPKGVWFKKQKYHCIYEYPKEPESPVLPNQDLWKQTEFKVFADTPATANLAEEFFITSSTQPFHTHSLSSQFFPGSSTWNFDNATPDSGMEDITPGSVTYSNEFSGLLSSVPTLRQLASEVVNRKKIPKSSSTDSLGGLRHTRKLLKLDLPPSPSAFTSDKIFTIEPTVEPVIREKPAFTTFGKSRFMVQHVDTPPDESKAKNVSFEALPYKPLSPTADINSLRGSNVERKPITIVHDFSLLKPDIEIVERSLIKNEDDKCKLKVEVVRGEASLLDSGDEDSGIESTSTLERKVSNPEL